jgi:HlyD family secretion protein
VRHASAPDRDTMTARDRAVDRAGGATAFDAALLRLEETPPSPLPRRLLYTLLALLTVLTVALFAGRLDVVAVADGRLVPRTLLKIVQPADAGVVREILVEEGMAIIAGQPVLRLDARLADADLRAQRTELAQRLLQLRRLDAELEDHALERHPDDPDELFTRAVAQLSANRTAYADAVAQASALVARIEQELAAAIEVQEKMSRTLPIAQTMAVRYDRLRAEGFVSELFALERERDRIEREQDLRAQRHTVKALQASLEQATRQRGQVVSNHRRQLHADRADSNGQVARLREEVDKQLVRREQVELTSPQAGVVKDLAIRTVGTVVSAGTVLLTLVPAGDALEAEVFVRNEDAGFVRVGQRAQLKVAAFPFQKYGLIEAEVLRIGPDATEVSANRISGDEAQPAGGYRARLALSAQSLTFDGSRLPLTSGMSASAEIHLGYRAVLDYLLAPVQKAWHEAARER